jgi:hypothetical protein
MSTSQSSLAGQKGLKTGALGLMSSVVIGMASTAPAFSLAAALGWVVLSGVGVKAPGIERWVEVTVEKCRDAAVTSPPYDC